MGRSRVNAMQGGRKLRISKCRQQSCRGQFNGTGSQSLDQHDFDEAGQNERPSGTPLARLSLNQFDNDRDAVNGGIARTEAQHFRQEVQQHGGVEPVKAK